MHWAVLALICSGCLRTTSVTCDDGRVCPGNATCYFRPGSTTSQCLDADQKQSCVGRVDGDPCSTQRGSGLCASGVCFDEECGDGFQTLTEQCDGNDLGAMTNCTDLGFYDDKPVTCLSNCTYDREACTGKCGDDIINGPELCDGAPPQKSCADLGFAHGFLECSICGPGLANCGHLGWQVSTVAPQPMFDVHGTSDNNVFAAGANGTVLYYNGSIWTSIDITGCQPTPSDYSFKAVFTVGVKEAFVGGPGGILIHVTASGCTRYFVNNQMDVHSIYDLWATSATDIYAGTGSGLWRFDGSTWTKVDAVPAFSVWGRSANDIYAADISNGQTSLRHFNGSTWADVSPAVTPAFTQINAIFGDANSVYVGGKNADGAAVAKRVGSSFSLVLTGRSGAIASGSVFNGRVFTGGTTQTLQGDIGEVLTFDNTTWTDLRLAAQGNVFGSITGMWVSDSGQLFEAGGSTRLIQTYPGGMFVDQDVGALGIAIAVSRRNANEAFAIVDRSIHVWDESDHAWVLDHSGVTDPIDDIWVDPSTGEAYALRQLGGLLRRASPGVWTNINSINASKLWGIAANDLWLVTGNTISHWNGSQITPRCTDCVPGQMLRALHGSSATNVFAVGTGGSIVHWNGSQWSAMTSGTTENLWAVWATSSGDAWAVGEKSVVLHYDGTTWTKIPIDTSILLLSVTGSGPSDMFVGGESGALYHWDGAHFSRVRIATIDWIQAMTTVGDSVYIVDQSGVVHRLIRTVSW